MQSDYLEEAAVSDIEIITEKDSDLNNCIASIDSIDKDFVNGLKKEDVSIIYKLFYEKNLASSALVNILKNMGRLPMSFDYEVFVGLMDCENDDVRYWAVKNIGKSKSDRFYNLLINRFKIEESTIVKREIVSSVGRMKSRLAIPFLVGILKNEDPKILSQAIRALLYFKGDPAVDETLLPLVNHENEIIKTAIYKEYFSKKENVKSKQPHAESYDYLKNVAVNGDVRSILPFVKDESVHLTFTSPPYYNARDYSIYPSYEAYLKFLEEVFSETYRITKEGRFLIVNTSPVIIPRISRAHSSKRYPIPFDLHGILVKMGWEFIDDIIWMKPEYSVKNRVGGFQQHRKPLGYKPNSITEYVMVYRKKTEKLLDWNMKKYSSSVVEDSKIKGEFETTNVWKICPKSDKIHPAVFPEELCKKIVEYYSYKGDLVFDPFAGIGTFGKAAEKMERYFFLAEKDETYFEYMKESKLGCPNQTNIEAKFLSLKEFKESIKDDVEGPSS